MTRQSFHIGLMIDALSGYGHRILDGIGRYARQKPDWRFAFFDRGQGDLATLVRSWKGDAIICTALDDRFSKAAYGRNIPVLNVTGRISRSNMIDVIGDANASGVMAAEFLLARGFQTFAMVGDKDEAAYSRFIRFPAVWVMKSSSMPGFPNCRARSGWRRRRTGRLRW